MTDQTPRPQLPIDIQEPCTKTWGELQGDEKRRYCSECRLHVHAAAELTRDEARELVSHATSRVCMRVQYDPTGAPIFRDSKPTPQPTARPAQRPASRLVRWAVSAAVGVLAACTGRVSTPEQPALPASGGDDTNGGETTLRMGKVAAPPELLGDVALPTPEPPPELLGEVYVPPEPAPAPAPAPTPTPTPDEPPAPERVGLVHVPQQPAPMPARDEPGPDER